MLIKGKIPCYSLTVLRQGAYGMVRVVRDTITQAVFALKQMSKADLTYKSRVSVGDVLSQNKTEKLNV